MYDGGRIRPDSKSVMPVEPKGSDAKEAVAEKAAAGKRLGVIKPRGHGRGYLTVGSLATRPNTEEAPNGPQFTPQMVPKEAPRTRRITIQRSRGANMSRIVGHFQSF